MQTFTKVGTSSQQIAIHISLDDYLSNICTNCKKTQQNVYISVCPFCAGSMEIVPNISQLKKDLDAYTRKILGLQLGLSEKLSNVVPNRTISQFIRLNAIRRLLTGYRASLILLSQKAEGTRKYTALIPVLAEYLQRIEKMLGEITPNNPLQSDFAEYLAYFNDIQSVKSQIVAKEGKKTARLEMELRDNAKRLGEIKTKLEGSVITLHTARLDIQENFARFSQHVTEVDTSLSQNIPLVAMLHEYVAVLGALNDIFNAITLEG